MKPKIGDTRAGVLYKETGSSFYYFPFKFVRRVKGAQVFRTLTIDTEEVPSEQATVQNTFFYYDPSHEVKEVVIDPSWKKRIVKKCFELAEIEAEDHEIE